MITQNREVETLAVRELLPIPGINSGFQYFIGFLLGGIFISGLHHE